MSYVKTVPPLNMVDETFVVAEPAVLVALLHDPDRCRQWWPDLRLSVLQDRAEQGIRWQATGALIGNMEVWLEKFGDGVIVHYYLRAKLAGAPASSARRAAKAIRRRQLHLKRVFWQLKDELEGSRRPGDPRG